MDKRPKNIMCRRFTTRQVNSKAFVGFMRSLFPNVAMSVATQKLSEDLYDAITYGEDIGKKYKKMLNGKKPKK